MWQKINVLALQQYNNIKAINLLQYNYITEHLQLLAPAWWHHKLSE